MSHVVFFSDLHLANWDAYSRIDPETGLNSRMLDGISILRQIREHCVKNKIKLAVFTGDMFHSSKKLEPDLLEMWVREILAMAQEGIKIMALPGQHDNYSQEGLINALGPFRHLFYQLMDSVGAWSLPDGNVQFITCPNRKGSANQKEDLQKAQEFVKKGTKNIFLGHFLVKEILEADGMTYGSDVVSADDLPKGCALYAFGDYHPHVWLPKQKLLSIGATNHHTFGSKNRPQGGFLDFDLASMTFKRVEVDAPMFVEVPVGEKFPDGHDPKNFYKIKVQDQKKEDRIRAKIDDEWQCAFEMVAPEEDEGEEEAPRLQLDFSTSPENVLREYCQYLGQGNEVLKKGLGFL